MVKKIINQIKLMEAVIGGNGNQANGSGNGNNGNQANGSGNGNNGNQGKKW